nr:peptidase S10, serine carboxypeptidase, alpha/beta hydrolase fold protein [Tanacetum cinerariifolium]
MLTYGGSPIAYASQPVEIVSPLTDRFIDFNSRLEFQHRVTLISDEIYESTKQTCHGLTSFAPVTEKTMTIVEESKGQYHVLIIIADGQ